jgi:hypothetical protein
MSPLGRSVYAHEAGSVSGVASPWRSPATMSGAARGRQEARRRPVARPARMKKAERSVRGDWHARGVVSPCAAESQRRCQPGQHLPQR